MTVKRLTLDSYAKLNLYLEVLGKRKDGYHDLTTLFERISLADKIILKALPSGEIKISSDSSSLPCDESNLAYKAAKLLQDKLKVSKGVEIEIIKRIPLASGMAGGSSNAATTLLGLNKLWGLKLSRKKLISYAKKLGADVPFFIHDLPFALALGRGDKINPVNSLQAKRFWHILVVPQREVGTVLIFKKWDELNRANSGQKARLTRARYNVKILILALLKKDFSLISKILFNNLQQVTSLVYPEVCRITHRLREIGLEPILMSGSGPTVFAIVSSKKEALKFSGLFKKDRTWRVFTACTL